MKIEPLNARKKKKEARKAKKKELKIMESRMKGACLINLSFWGMLIDVYSNPEFSNGSLKIW